MEEIYPFYSGCILDGEEECGGFVPVFYRYFEVLSGDGEAVCDVSDVSVEVVAEFILVGSFSVK